MGVFGVILVYGVLRLGVDGVEVKEATAVKKEVEKIFKTVEGIMAGRNTEVKRNSITSTSPSIIRDEPRNQLDDVKVLAEAPTPHAMSRSYVEPLAPFPIGVIVSDHLYPLVVGRNTDTGKPFVMNLDKQHAMVVARGSGEGGYRLVIPFPVMIGSGAHKLPGLEEEEPMGPLSAYRNHPSSPPGYYSHPPEAPHGRANYREESPAAINSKYAHNYQYRHHDDNPYLEEPRYNKYPVKVPKKFSRPTNLNVHPRNRPYPGGNQPKLTRPLNPAYLTNPEKQLSYYVEGPKYNPPVPLGPKKYYPVAYRHTASSVGPYHPPQPYSYSPQFGTYPPGASGPRKNSPYRNYYSEPPLYNPQPLRRPTPVYGGVPKDFKPSPYIGKIADESRDDSDREPEENSTLDPQSERYESYDDRGDEMDTEKDFEDPTLDRPEGRHSSSGGVRHVTYHADDYLGKIYEEMYYRLPSTERIGTGPESNLESRAPQVFPLQDYQLEGTTEAAERRSDQATLSSTTEAISSTTKTANNT